VEYPVTMTTHVLDGTPDEAGIYLRIVRPSRDLARTERFWVSG